MYKIAIRRRKRKYNESRVTRVNAFASMLHDRSRAKDDKCRIKRRREAGGVLRIEVFAR